MFWIGWILRILIGWILSTCFFMHSWLITWITQSKKWRRLELIYKDTWKGKFPVIDQNLDMKQMKTQWKALILFMVARCLQRNINPKATKRIRIKMASSTTTITIRLGLLACKSSAKGYSVTVFPNVTP